MGFFSKIFRRKPSESTGTTKKQQPRGLLGRRNNNKYSNNTQVEDDRDDSPTDMEEPPVLFPPQRSSYTGGPVDLDEVEASTLGEEEPTVTITQPTHHQRPALRLSSERLAEFTQQQKYEEEDEEPNRSPRSPNNNNNNNQRTFTMEAEPVIKSNTSSNSKKMFTAGQIAVAVDDHSESSSFNLSTDAEDTEYEDLKKHGIVRKNAKALNKNQLNLSADASYVDRVSNLLTDDEGNSVRSGPSLLLQNSNTGRSVSSPLTRNGGSKDATNPVGSAFSASRGEVTSPKSSQDDFANFADFSSFGNDAVFPKPEPSPSPAVAAKFKIRIVSSNSNNINAVTAFTRSTPSVGSDSSISELLAQARSTKFSRSQRSGNSVNSAPAMTAAQIRAHHGIKPRDHDGTSVSDIIKSLEADNASRSRQMASNKRHSDAYSTQSRDASVRSAKERLRRRRESERRRSHPDDASTDSDEDAESWLMDEVTGALGPRGIAADLESLSGRSHKSHRSHHSRKSRPSTRHRSHNTSGESVDSQGSKRSGGSRRSRYSHRSTKSYMSQMSEQSRSVANDLLRLEMQLAMVNPSSVLNPDSTRTSRSSRRHGRSRISVVAPPGKLGIILANKADSRGTVVSGVRTSSALADRISPGDRIVAIDGEDVSLMTVSEITTIMARKSEYDRTLTVLTTPKSLGSPESGYE